MKLDGKTIYAQSSDIKSRTYLEYRRDMKKKAIAELEVFRMAGVYLLVAGNGMMEMKGNRTIPLTLLIIKILSISIILSTLFLSYFIAMSRDTQKSPKDFWVTSKDPVLRSEPQSEAFTRARDKMVKQDIEGRGIKDKRVLSAMSKIPRHFFVAKGIQRMAYGDHPLPIGEGQTISQPYVVALMTEVLELKEGDKVLEIGTGSGYQAAVLAEIAKEVYTIEIRESLSFRAETTLKSLGYKNIKIKTADGYYGWKEYAPFDAVIITCAANHVPRPLIEQLKEGGRLVIPLGSTRYYQTLTLIKKVKGELKVRHITDVAFVPMIGEAERQR